MVLLLDALGFSLTDKNIQTLPCFDSGGRLGHHAFVHSLGSCSDAAPFATADFYQFIEKNLVVFVDCDIFFVCHEFLVLHAVVAVLFELVCNISCFFHGSVGSGNHRHFLHVLLHFVLAKHLDRGALLNPGWSLHLIYYIL